MAAADGIMRMIAVLFVYIFLLLIRCHSKGHAVKAYIICIALKGIKSKARLSAHIGSGLFKILTALYSSL